MARPKQVLISRDAVIEAAMKIIEEEGFDALSLRRLGQALNVNFASFYHHFSGKEEILESVARQALKEIELPPLQDDWQEWICGAAVGYRRLLVAKPYLIPLMLNGYRPRTVATAINEAKLAEAGIAAEHQAEIIFALDTTVVGSALVTIASHRDRKKATGDVAKFDHERILKNTINTLLDSYCNVSKETKVKK